MRDAVSTGIEYGALTFPMWEAAVAAGATLDELCRLDDGGYPKRFLVKLLAWKQMRDLVRINAEDAVARAAKRRAKRGKK